MSDPADNAEPDLWDCLLFSRWDVCALHICHGSHHAYSILFFCGNLMGAGQYITQPCPCMDGMHQRSCSVWFLWTSADAQSEQPAGGKHVWTFDSSPVLWVSSVIFIWVTFHREGNSCQTSVLLLDRKRIPIKTRGCDTNAFIVLFIQCIYMMPTSCFSSPQVWYCTFVYSALGIVGYSSTFSLLSFSQIFG